VQEIFALPTGSPRLWSDAVYVSMPRLRVAPDRATEPVAAFRDRVHLVDGADGFAGLEALEHLRAFTVVAR